MKLELYYTPYCPFCIRVLSSLKNLGIEDKLILKNTQSDSSCRDFHFKTTGRNTVPCLYIDNKPMFESSDIIDWLSNNKNKI